MKFSVSLELLKSGNPLKLKLKKNRSELSSNENILILYPSLYLTRNECYEETYNEQEYSYENTICSSIKMDIACSVVFKNKIIDESFIKKVYAIYDTPQKNGYLLTIYSKKSREIIIANETILYDGEKKVLDVICDWIVFEDGTFLKFQNCSKIELYSKDILFTLNKLEQTNNHIFYKYKIGKKIATLIKAIDDNICYVLHKSFEAVIVHDGNYHLLGKAIDFTILSKTTLKPLNWNIRDRPNLLSLKCFDRNSFEYLHNFFGNTKDVLELLASLKKY